MIEEIKRIIGLKKGKTIFQSFSEEASKSLETVKVMDKLINAYCKKEDISSFVEEIKELENAVDKINVALGEKLYAGALLPYTSEDWFELSELIDSVADHSDRIARLANSYKATIPEEIKDNFKRLSKKTVDAVKILYSSVLLLKEDLDKAKDKTEDVHGIRDKVREIEYGIFTKILNSKIRTRDALFIKELAFEITQIANTAHTACTKIKMMAVKYSF